MKKILSVFCMASLIVSCVTIKVFATQAQVGVTYQAHVENIGWQDPVVDGNNAGTTGEGLRVEALNVKLTNAPAGAKIVYQAHVENIGWQNPVADGQNAGTTGNGLRIEALKISLENMPGYSVEYQAHVENIGWQDPVYNGQLAGTTGQGLRIEAIRIRIVPTPTSVSLNKTSDMLSVGDSETLNASIAPANEYNQGVTWSSSNNSIATVDNTGKVFALSAGTAAITATTKAGNRISTCNLTINNIRVTGINLNKNTDVLPVGGTDSLTSNISPQNATNKNVVWSSTNNSIVEVDSTGKITGKSAGTATITATTADGSNTSSCNVTINNVGVTGISLNKNTDVLPVGGTDSLTSNISPQNATNKNVTWSTTDNSIAAVDNTGKVTAKKVGTATITATTEDGNKTSNCVVTVTNPPPSVVYQAQVENIGWQNAVADGGQAGTVGQALRLEALKININNVAEGAKIKYQAYVENQGWQSEFNNGQLSGTVGKGLRIEAMKISLEDVPGYSIEYRVQVENIGWQSWVMDGNIAGTEGRSLRIEAIQIKLVKSMDVQYKTHVENIGWQAPVSNGAISGTDGQPLRIEALSLQLNNAPMGASIEYQAHVENIGWQSWVKDGDNAGTVGQGLRIEALKIKLVGVPGYSVQYQVYVENLGWQPWTGDGQEAGTDGRGLRIEAIRVRVVSNADAELMPSTSQTSLAYSLASYLDSNENIQNVESTAVGLHGGIQENNCVYFSSEAMRRIGFYVPKSMANTASYVPYLVSKGFIKQYNLDFLFPGSMCFTVNDSTGNPTHTFVFMGWVNPDDHTLAYVVDNQANTIHVRSMIDAPNIDAFSFYLHN